MNRNNGREIADRLHLLRDYFIKHADRTHAVSMAYKYIGMMEG